MSYSKTTWQNGVTPINETNLNKIENGIYANDSAISSLDSTKANLSTTPQTLAGDRRINSLELTWNSTTNNYELNLSGIATGTTMNFTIPMADSQHNPFGDIYSTTEKQIGTWYDGKPLYQKTIYSTTTTGSLGLSNIDMIRFKNLNVSVDNFLFPDARYNNANDSLEFFINTNTMTFACTLGSSWANNFNYLVFEVEYTKTTD